MSGQSKLVVGTNSNLIIYAGGNLSLKGGGAVNQTGFATNLTVYGQPNCSRIEFTGGSDFTGVIYAPSAETDFKGGGNTLYNFSGSIVALSLLVDGKYQIHYDESLSKTPAGANYYVTSWKEQ